jgi:hypothetical protein
MSLHADMITPNASRSSYPSLFEGVIVTSTLAVVVGFGFVAVYIFNRGIVPAVLVLTIAAGMGLTTGFISRFELPGRSSLVCWWVALFSLCVGMIPQGWLSGGVLGFDLITHELIKPDLDGLLRLFLGATSAWLAVRAWAGRLSPQSSSMPDRRGLRARIRPSHMQSNASGDVAAPSGVNIVAPNPRSPNTPSVVRPSGRQQTFNLRRPKFGAEGPKKWSIKRNRQRRIHAAIHLTENIEHRCPFCLELVERSDSSGSVECTICHTLHHADCWAVTGTCQVPHHNI